MTDTSTDAPASTTPAPVRVAIVDDHESVRLGIQAACQAEGFDVVLTAAGVQELVESLAGR